MIATAFLLERAGALVAAWQGDGAPVEASGGFGLAQVGLGGLAPAAGVVKFIGSRMIFAGVYPSRAVP